MINEKEENLTTVNIPPQSGQEAAREDTPHPAHHKRTPGLKIFDVLLYPIFTNLVVFGISVGATYLTNRGHTRTPDGKLMYGEIGQWFAKRGDWLVEKFKGMGMNHEQAKMSKMVFFSFADGTLIAPFVKVLEDNREGIAKGIDNVLGTTPADNSAYAAEPKQSWSSVIGGRLAACSLVVPTAYVLDKKGWNKKLFEVPGNRLGKWALAKPGVAKMFGQHDAKELFRVSVFEAFYTSVCTAGLYVLSRFIAKKQNHYAHVSEAAAHAERHEKAAEERIIQPAADEPHKRWTNSVKMPAANHTELMAEPTVMGRA